MNDIATTDRGYCFNHHGRTTFDVIQHIDGQETVTCRKCGAVGHGKAV